MALPCETCFMNGACNIEKAKNHENGDVRIVGRISETFLDKAGTDRPGPTAVPRDPSQVVPGQPEAFQQCCNPNLSAAATLAGTAIRLAEQDVVPASAIAFSTSASQ